MSNDQVVRIFRLLRRLEELRKSGVLTQEEYEERVAVLKKQLETLSSKKVCPRCGSGNVIGYKGIWECFNCGYKFKLESVTEYETTVKRSFLSYQSRTVKKEKTILYQELKTAKYLGGIAALIWLFSSFVTSFDPYFSSFIDFISLIMLLVAVSKISEIFHDPKIRSNYLIYFIFVIIVIFTSVLLEEAFIYAFFFGFDLDILIRFWTLVCVPFIIGTFFLKRSYEAIEKRTGVKSFGTAATLYFIGAILLLVAIGAILIFIADIFNIVAFFSIPEKADQP